MKILYLIITLTLFSNFSFSQENLKKETHDYINNIIDNYEKQKTYEYLSLLEEYLTKLYPNNKVTIIYGTDFIKEYHHLSVNEFGRTESLLEKENKIRKKYNVKVDRWQFCNGLIEYSIEDLQKQINEKHYLEENRYISHSYLPNSENWNKIKYEQQLVVEVFVQVEWYKLFCKNTNKDSFNSEYGKNKNTTFVSYSSGKIINEKYYISPYNENTFCEIELNATVTIFSYFNSELSN